MADWLEAWPLIQLLGVTGMSGFVLCWVYLARKKGQPDSQEPVVWEPSLRTVSSRGGDLLWHYVQDWRRRVNWVFPSP